MRAHTLPGRQQRRLQRQQRRQRSVHPGVVVKEEPKITREGYLARVAARSGPKERGRSVAVSRSSFERAAARRSPARLALLREIRRAMNLAKPAIGQSAKAIFPRTTVQHTRLDSTAQLSRRVSRSHDYPVSRLASRVLVVNFWRETHSLLTSLWSISVFVGPTSLSGLPHNVTMFFI